MNKSIHGGDVYTNKVNIDFSVNVNPLGVPLNVKQAMVEAINHIGEYPDIRYNLLAETCASKLDIKKEHLIFGNGSSELFVAIANTLRPNKVVIPVPSFLGYEYAFSNVCENIFYYHMKEEDGYRLTEELLNTLYGSDCIVIANPNNPTGATIDKSLLIGILDVCNNENIKVILDECFIEFTEEESMIDLTEKYSNMIIVRSFTKIYAIPSVRLGYMICSDDSMVDAIRRNLPEWNVSGLAQCAGVECFKCTDYITETKEYVKKEREFLCAELRKLGIKVYDSLANYLFIYFENALYDILLNHGLLIRDCSNYRGLSDGYYRIAIKTHEENKHLISVLNDYKTKGLLHE